VDAAWLAVLAFGAWHGLNPAMGWPLAVANGLSEGRPRALLATALPLAAGHLAAMAVVLLPFALAAGLLPWSRELRLAAGALVLGFGIWRLLQRRHPRALQRVRPTQLAWWSFLMASAHGAALMMLPLTLGLCAAGRLPAGATAATVAGVHTAAMLATGLGVAWAVYRVLGLRFLRQGWLNLDALWAASLIAAGAAGLVQAAGSA